MLQHSVAWALQSHLQCKTECNQRYLTLACEQVSCQVGKNWEQPILTLSEAILGPAGHVPEMPHATSACSLPPDGLSRPVVCSKQL